MSKKQPSAINFVLTFVAVAVIARIFFFFLAAISPNFLPFQPSFSYPEMLETYSLPKWIHSFAGFDGVHYITIAERGYESAGMIQAFFPVWPLLLQAGHTIFSVIGVPQLNTISWGVTLNFLLLPVLLYVWHQFVITIYPEFISAKYKWLPTAVLLAFPTSLFFFALYSETLFLTLILGTFLAAHTQNWKLAILLAIIASATRIVGVLLVPALLLEYWWQQQSLATQKFEWLAVKKSLQPAIIVHFLLSHYKMIATILLGSLGLLAYMTYLYIIFGDPLLFKTVQSDWGHERSDTLVMYPQVVVRYIRMLTTSFTLTVGWFTIVQEFLSGLFLPLSPLLLYKKIRPSHLFFGIAVLLIPISTGTFSSLLRYALASFPVFLVLLYLLKDKPKASTAWLAFSTFLLICNTILFIQGYWVA
jgi:hypothetical protein